MNEKRSREDGAVAVFVAVLILPLTLLLAFAVDTGNWWTHKRHLQTQADAGVFAGGFGPWFPACNETAIETKARQYAGNPSSTSPYNPQYTNGSNVHVLLNSTDYYENGGSDFSASGTPCQTLAQANESHPGFLDLKVTESSLANLFGSIPGFDSVTIHTHARVEIQGALQEDAVRPVAIRDDSQYKCAQAQLWQTDGNGNFTTKFGSVISLPSRTVLADTSVQFQNPSGASVTMPSKTNSNPPHLAVQILLGNTGCTAVDAYADPSGGLNVINVYQPPASQPAGDKPKLGSVSMPPGLSNCTPDPYFSTKGCGAVVKAYVAFASGAITSGSTKNAFVTINGVDATADTDSDGLYWTASIPIGAQSGPHPITIAWKQKFGTQGKTDCSKGQGCSGTFGVEQEAFSATDDDSVTNSGEISLVQVADGGNLYANSLVQGTTHNLVITVVIKGLQNSKPTDPPIIIRNSNQNSKRTGLIDCGQGNGAQSDHDAIVNGCPLGVYIWPDGSTCVVPPSDPIDCVNPIPGNRRQKIASAIKDRINGACNYWNAYRDSGSFDIANYIRADDPRAVTVIITSPADLSGNSNGPPIPVLALATFYVTGYDGTTGNGTGCQNEPYPGSGSQNFQFWGHWIKFAPVGGGIGNGKGCDATTFGDCIAVLTK
jgi:hypothetical protein